MSSVTSAPYDSGSVYSNEKIYLLKSCPYKSIKLTKQLRKEVKQIR